MKGVPLRLELGPRDIENNQCVICRRDNGEKIVVSLDELEDKIPQLLAAVHEGMFNKALERRNQMTYDAHNSEEMRRLLITNPALYALCGVVNVSVKMHLKRVLA